MFVRHLFWFFFPKEKILSYVLMTFIISAHALWSQPASLLLPCNLRKFVKLAFIYFLNSGYSADFHLVWLCQLSAQVFLNQHEENETTIYWPHSWVERMQLLELTFILCFNFVYRQFKDFLFLRSTENLMKCQKN